VADLEKDMRGTSTGFDRDTLEYSSDKKAVFRRLKIRRNI
jgi:hypothetical protein